MAFLPQAVAETSALAGKPWIVERIGGAGIVDRSRVPLHFTSEGRLAGIASCNRYTAIYTAKGGHSPSILLPRRGWRAHPR